MDKLIKFENTTIDMQIINNVPLFELYTVGMALGYVKTNGKSKGVHSVHPETKQLFPFKSRIDKVVKNAEIVPCVHNAHKYITESQIYDFMLEARTDKCRAFRKWLTNEVLPSIRKTGKYSMHTESEPKQLELYDYFDKTYKGEPVLTSADVEYITGIRISTIDWFLRTKLVKGQDYYYITGADLVNFKKENPKVSKLASVMNLITKNGFEEICKAYGIKIETPKVFIEEKKAKECAFKNILPATKEKMSAIRKEAEQLIHLTYLLDLDIGTMLPTEVYKHYESALVRQAKSINMYVGNPKPVNFK